MSVKDIFAERFTLLRTVHHQTYRDLGNVLNLNANTVTEWAVSRRNFPNPDKLVLIANLYAVSVDWLLGRTNILYNEEIMASIEDSMILNFLASVYEIPVEYSNASIRGKHYSLAIRANIITLTFTSQYSAVVQVLGKDFFKKDNFESEIKSNSLKIRNAFIDKLVNQGNLVEKMLVRETTKPVFDVEFEFRHPVKK